jgi:hypothetical protein
VSKKICLAVLFCCAASICFAAQKHPAPEQVQAFELYSWQDAKGEWDFSLFPAIISAGLSPGVIFRKDMTLKGPAALEQAMAKLPAGSVIYWLDHTLGIYKDAKESELLKYPSAEMIAEIRRYCESKQFKLVVEPPKKTEKH